jgi:hypothetical protein
MARDISTATPRVATPAEVHATFRHDLRPAERATLTSWLAFTTTFAGVRTVTHSIRSGRGPFRNLSVGGQHLHHYMWGIGLLTGVGAIAVSGTDEQKNHPSLSVAYGSGLALIVDELALLLDLRDVYWAKEGRVSVDVAVGVIAVTGTALASIPLWARLRDRRKHPSAVDPPPSSLKSTSPGSQTR